MLSFASRHATCTRQRFDACLTNQSMNRTSTETSLPATKSPRKGVMQPPRPVTLLASCLLPTRFGRFSMNAYAVKGAEMEFVCLALGDVSGEPPPLVRLHSECLTGDVLGSLRCDCGQQLETSLEMIAGEKRGLLFYLRQEGRGIGLVNKVRAYGLQDDGLDTIDANLALGLPVDSREYRTAALLLHHLDLTQIRLITNNLRKCEALQESGIEIVERVPIAIEPNPSNIAYLRTKARRLGHLLDLESVVEPEGKTA